MYLVLTSTWGTFLYENSKGIGRGGERERERERKREREK
jgi:hypothetical protein